MSTITFALQAHEVADMLNYKLANGWSVHVVQNSDQSVLQMRKQDKPDVIFSFGTVTDGLVTKFTINMYISEHGDTCEWEVCWEYNTPAEMLSKAEQEIAEVCAVI